MTNYGTISTSSPNTVPNLEYLSRTKDRIKAGLGTRRPWKLMLNYQSLNLPTSLSNTISRIRTNTTYFRMNYAIIMLFILFSSLLWHPVSLIVFVVMMAAWLFLYFLRDEPLELFNKVVDDRVVLIFLAVVTLAALLLTRVTLNVLVAVAVGAVVVLVHAALIRSDDLCLDEGDNESTGFLAGKGRSTPSQSQN